MTNQVLKVNRVAKSFSSRRVLEDVTLTMCPGDMIGIVGENGSGKSTLLKILVGLLAPSSGSVFTHGRIGYCPQDVLVFNTLTVNENFRQFATAYNLDGKSDGFASWKVEKESLLEHFKFKEYEDAPVSTLSGGTRQKLNLSLALLHQPDLLILDEPYTGFDWETYLRFWQMTADLRRRGRSLLIVSHFIYDREKFDGIFELKGGVLECV
jgi:ABC-2 type transport system ATP-binding protein